MGTTPHINAQEKAKLRKLLRDVIHEEGHSVGNLADLSGVSPPTIYGLMAPGSTKRAVRRSTFMKLSRACEQLAGRRATRTTVREVMDHIDALERQVEELSEALRALRSPVQSLADDAALKAA